MDGNERLTATNAVVLLVLLAAEGATIPFVRQRLTLHIFLGLLLIPPVLLKLASTGWRFARYYLATPSTSAKGHRTRSCGLLVAPLTVASTAALFGTGVLLVLIHPRDGLFIGLHKASFIVWFGAMGVHVLATCSSCRPGARRREDVARRCSELRQLADRRRHRHSA